MGLLALSPDFLRLIAGYLCLVDVATFRLLCKLVRDVVQKPDIRKIVVKRLVGALPDEKEAEAFCDAIYETGAMIAGSFILDCIYGTNFHSDIDIYEQRDKREPYDPVNTMTPCPNSDRFSKHLLSAGFRYSSPTEEFQGHVREWLHPSLCFEYIRNVPKAFFVGNDKKIQVISSGVTPSPGKISTVGKCILASFDLDICKVGFDGRNLYVRSWPKLIYRIDHIVPNTRFLLSFYDDGPANEESFEKRKQKYISRGFTILSHPFHAEIKSYIDYLRHKQCYFCENGRYEDCPLQGEMDGIEEIRAGTINLDVFSTSFWSVQQLVFSRDYSTEFICADWFTYRSCSAKLKKSTRIGETKEHFVDRIVTNANLVGKIITYFLSVSRVNREGYSLADHGIGLSSTLVKMIDLARDFLLSNKPRAILS